MRMTKVLISLSNMRKVIWTFLFEYSYFWAFHCKMQVFLGIKNEKDVQANLLVRFVEVILATTRQRMLNAYVNSKA